MRSFRDKGAITYFIFYGGMFLLNLVFVYRLATFKRKTKIKRTKQQRRGKGRLDEIVGELKAKSQTVELTTQNVI